MPSSFPKWKLSAFTLLSVCDFAVTYFLLSRSKGTVYESNPVANEWLQQGGWIGLAVFKSAIVFAVAIIATYLFYRRPRIAHDLLAVGCGAVIVTVLTGATIAVTRTNRPLDEENSAPAISTRLHDKIADRGTVQYMVVMDDVAVRLVSREYSLQQCAEHLRSTELAQDPAWIESLRRVYPGVKGDSALLAAELIQHAVGSRLRQPIAASLAERLENEFRLLYGTVPKFPYRRMLHLDGTAPQDPERTDEALPVPV